MSDIRKDFENLAKLAPEYTRASRDADMITVLADKYCEAVDKGDESNKSIYISALMLKFWDNVDRIYQKVKQVGYEYEDCVSQLFKCINTACEYRAWKDGTTSAKACINQVIASRGAPEILYQSNLDSSKANVNTTSLDYDISDDDEGSKTVMDTIDDGTYEEDKSASYATSIIQYFINNNKLIEAILLDNIAFNNCTKDIKVEVNYTNEIGELSKCVGNRSEFWAYKLMTIINSLPDSYANDFASRYTVNDGALKASLADIRKSNNQKLYKYLAKALQTAGALFKQAY